MTTLRSGDAVVQVVAEEGAVAASFVVRIGDHPEQMRG